MRDHGKKGGGPKTPGAVITPTWVKADDTAELPQVGPPTEEMSTIKVILPPRLRDLDSGSHLGKVIKAAEVVDGINPHAGFANGVDVDDIIADDPRFTGPLDSDPDDAEFRKTPEFGVFDPPVPVAVPPKKQWVPWVVAATLLIVIAFGGLWFKLDHKKQTVLQELQQRKTARTAVSVDTAVYRHDAPALVASVTDQADVMSVLDTQTHVTKVVASSCVHVVLPDVASNGDAKKIAAKVAVKSVAKPTKQAEKAKPVEVAKVEEAKVKPEPQPQPKPVVVLASHTDVKASMQLAEDDEEDDGKYIYHTMMKGDTPASLAKRYFVSKWKIYHLNKKLQRAALRTACKKNHPNYRCTPNDRWFHRMAPGTKVYIRLKSEVQVRVAKADNQSVASNTTKTVKKNTYKFPRKTFLSKASAADKVGMSVVRVQESDKTWKDVTSRTGYYIWGKLYHGNVDRLVGDCIKAFPQSKRVRCDKDAWTKNMRAGSELLLPRKKKLRRRPKKPRKKKALSAKVLPSELKYSQKGLGPLAQVWIASHEVYHLLMGESYHDNLKTSRRASVLRRVFELKNTASVTSDKSGSSSRKIKIGAMVFSDLPTPKKNRTKYGHSTVF